MGQTYNFQTPRDLYEKLCRDSEKLDLVKDGDHLFNFIATAHHLKDWIKHSPLKTSTVIKRLFKTLKNDENLKICSDIVTANAHFKIQPHKKGCQLKVGKVCIDAIHFKNEIMELYEHFFKIK